MGVDVVGCMAFVYFPLFCFLRVMAMQVDSCPCTKKIDIPKTTTTMSIQPINHMPSALGGVGWFCILHLFHGYYMCRKGPWSSG